MLGLVVPATTILSMMLLGFKLMEDHDKPCTDVLGAFLTITGGVGSGLFAMDKMQAWITDTLGDGERELKEVRSPLRNGSCKAKGSPGRERALSPVKTFKFKC